MSKNSERKEAQRLLFEEQFKTQKSLSKKDVLLLKPGRWLQVKWNDSPNSMVILLEKPRHEAGDLSLYCFHTDVGRADRRVIHSQVVAVHGMVMPRAPLPAGVTF